MPLKSVSTARENLEDQTRVIGDRYEKQTGRAKWQEKASSDSAEDNFADAVSKAISEKKRQKKVREVSDSDWRRACAEKGAGIIGDRVKGALDKWEKNFSEKYDKVKDKVKRLPARSTDWEENVDKRLKPVIEAWKGE